MSPHQPSSNSDQQSEIARAPRGRPALPREQVLLAADSLFADATSGQAVSMDAIAAAAGVGKGTLFRAFASRDGLLEALVELKFTPVREAIQAGGEPGTTSRAQIAAFLDEVLTFKLDNRHLMRAREVESSGSLGSERYRWMHALLQRLLCDAAPRATTTAADYAAHVLLGALRIDLVEELLAAGRAPDDIRSAHAALTQAVVDGI